MCFVLLALIRHSTLITSSVAGEIGDNIELSGKCQGLIPVPREPMVTRDFSGVTTTGTSSAYFNRSRSKRCWVRSRRQCCRWSRSWYYAGLKSLLPNIPLRRVFNRITTIYYSDPEYLHTNPLKAYAILRAPIIYIPEFGVGFIRSGSTGPHCRRRSGNADPAFRHLYIPMCCVF